MSKVDHSCVITLNISLQNKMLQTGQITDELR